MAPITIRVRTPARMARVTIDSGASVADLKAAVATELGVPASQVVLSLASATGKPLPDSGRLTALGFANGQMVFLVSPPGAAFSASATAAVAPAPAAATTARGASGTTQAREAASPARTRKLTPRCQHGPTGACQYCCAADDADYAKISAEPLNKAAAFAPRHAQRSTAPDELSGELEWLCRHGPHQMCTNCAPLHKGDKVPLEMLCLHGPGAMCTNCLPPSTTLDSVHFISFDEWQERRQAKCEHSFSATCVNCIPPSLVSYKLKANCPRHKPFPAGLCSDCAPETAYIKQLQPYRHVDNIQINNVDEMGRFSQLYSVNAAAGLQRAAFLYGRYLPDPNYRRGVRAVVEALYEPPQTFDPVTAVVRMTIDPKQEKNVEKVAAAAGLTRIGWLFTTPPRPKDTPLLPRELLAMARLQNLYPRPDGKAGSRFVTLVLSPDGKDIVPRGFQASDQLMALERDGVFAAPGPSDAKLTVRKRGSASEPPLPDVIFTDAKRGNINLSEVDPSYFVVTMNALAPKRPEPGSASDAPNASAATGAALFKRSTFPVENRAAFGTVQDSAAVKKYLASVSREPPASRVGDFHFLVFLAAQLDPDTAAAMAKCAVSGEALPDGLTILLDALTR